MHARGSATVRTYAPWLPAFDRDLINNWAWTLVIAHAIAAFYAVNYVFPGRVDANFSLYVLQPLIWGSLAALSLLLIRLNPAPRTVPFVRVLYLGVWAAGFQVAALIGAGIVYGFGYSPYARETLHMMQNGLYLTTLILGVECARSYVLNVFYPRSAFLAITTISLFFALLLIPVSNFYRFDSNQIALQTLGETFLPAVSVSVLATYLAIYGGPLPAFLYHAGIRAFDWFSPILPALDWSIVAFVETAAPIVALITVRAAMNEPPPGETAPKKFDVSAPWLVATSTAVAILWFSTGLFGVQPVVVNGVSMEPTMQTGDLVIMRDTDAEDLEVGDVVHFTTGETPVIHRIVEIADTVNGRVFITQGDNNNTPDEPILEGQIDGEIVFRVPKLGWVPLGVTEVLRELR